jgi:hypothetical protein
MHDWFLAHYDVLKDFASPVVSLIGIVAASIVAICGFKSFERWKREQLEEHRIDLAIEGLAIARESKYVFGRIRNPHGFEGEWRSMPVREGESERDRNRRGSSYATLVRLDTDKDFFERVSRFLPKAIALFGDRVESIFERLAAVENQVRDAAMQLTWQLAVHPEKPSVDDFNYRMELRAALWSGFAGEKDRMEDELSTFRSEAEKLFRDVITKHCTQPDTWEPLGQTHVPADPPLNEHVKGSPARPSKPAGRSPLRACGG